MKQTVFLLMLAFGVISCHRNYKVIHAFPPVDSVAVAAQQIDTVEEEWYDEPLIDIPDAPQQEDFDEVDAKSRKEYDDFIHGR